MAIFLSASVPGCRSGSKAKRDCSLNSLHNEIAAVIQVLTLANEIAAMSYKCWLTLANETVLCHTSVDTGQ